jgi:hypothetical protein
MKPAAAARRNANALAALRFHLKHNPQSPLTVWQSGKVHGGLGSLGIQFATFADADTAIRSLGHAPENTAQGFTDYAPAAALEVSA